MYPTGDRSLVQLYPLLTSPWFLLVLGFSSPLSLSLKAGMELEGRDGMKREGWDEMGRVGWVGREGWEERDGKGGMEKMKLE